ncbi:MAG TPA: sulfocyanin-like copper-binding protein [Gemmatimonadales bacterium]|nr:sulfocyanin-like copper-binding protein [Gemmatimonadales bacterium]
MRRLAGLAALAILAAPLAAQEPPPRIDRSWLRIDRGARRVTFTLLAGATPTNGGLNFNGFTAGRLTLEVPGGWEVVVRHRNLDPKLPHSVELIGDRDPLPVQAVPPVVPGAASARLLEGIPPGGVETIRFTAPDGEYRLFCAVPGHGLAGMWLRVSVSTRVRTPALRATP